jgi:hypothetical protein
LKHGRKIHQKRCCAGELRKPQGTLDEKIAEFESLPWGRSPNLRKKEENLGDLTSTEA